MRYLVLALLFLIEGSAEVSSIHSKKAFYDRDTLVLQGDVHIENSLGKIRSGLAHLTRGEQQEEHFSKILLQENVQILIPGSGEIHCDKADLAELTGKLLPKKGEKVTYRSNEEPLFLESSSVLLDFGRENGEIVLEKLTGEDQVHLKYHEDQIDAKKAHFFPSSSKLILFAPKGELKSTVFGNNQTISFTCSQLTFQQEGRTLLLEDAITIQDEDLGEIRCSDTMELIQQKGEEGWKISTMNAKGLTEVCNLHTKDVLACKGQVFIDHPNQLLTMEGETDSSVSFTQETFYLTSKRALMRYKEQDNHLEPETILFEENVLLENGEAQCATADQFTYNPQEQKMILSAKEGNSVLFWDQNQQLTICAREVHISKTPRGDLIKGMGNVRFIFSQNENTTLKKLFPFYKGGVQ